MSEKLSLLVQEVDKAIKADALNAAARENTLFWFDIRKKAVPYSTKVINGIALTPQERDEYEKLVESGCMLNVKQAEKLLADGIITDEREFGRKCQEFSDMFYDELSKILEAQDDL